MAEAGSGMLGEILKNMYIDPELLAELDEDQKNVLFRSMREEQIRRWKQREEEESLKPIKKAKPKLNGKNHKNKKISFLKGADDKEWVWVMGEHENDLSIEEILEREAKEKAEEEARREAERFLKMEEEENERKLAEQEAEAKRFADENKMKESRVLREIQRKKSLEKRQQITRVKSMEIYEKITEKRNSIREEALKTEQEIVNDWKERERKANEAELKKRESFVRARQEVESQRKNNKNVNILTTLPKILSIIRKPNLKPRSRQEVIDWFRKNEKPKGCGIDPSTNKIADWFHGIINRQEAENLLRHRKSGSYLVRVSEKMLGYVLSVNINSIIKHFLIDTTNDGYQILSSVYNQAHKSLSEFINYYKVTPLSTIDGQNLVYPIGQQSNNNNNNNGLHDYDELMIDDGTESSDL